MELSKHDKIRLAKVMEESTLSVMRAVAGALVNQWNSGTVVGTSEHETIVNAVKREERQNALTLFLQELERLAHE